MSIVRKLLRPNIATLQPYSSARSEYFAKDAIFLDANENGCGSTATGGYERYPDPYQRHLKSKMAAVKRVDCNQIFLGNGSDEAIDLVIRAFCEPGVHEVLITAPTYGMYEVCGRIHGACMKSIPLDGDFDLDVEKMLSGLTRNTRLCFLCSPSNPTGNVLSRDRITALLEGFAGIVVLDEAYIDFCAELSLLPELKKFKNLIILQTLSKAWGLAGLRIGMAFGDPEIVDVLTQIKYPYNVNAVTQSLALQALDRQALMQEMRAVIVDERVKLCHELQRLSFVQRVFPSRANFLLVRMNEPVSVYRFLVSRGIIVRDRSQLPGCAGCLRITVGSREDNRALVIALNEYEVARREKK